MGGCMRTQERRDSARGSSALQAVLGTLLVGMATLLLAVPASAEPGDIFGPFPDTSGTFRNATNNASVVNPSNSFFDPHLGTNGQACVTCHQPDQGFSVIVPSIRTAF